MGTALRFFVVLIAVVCSLVGPAPRDFVHHATATAAVADDAVIPASVEARTVSAVAADDCGLEPLTLRPVWNYVREFLLEQVRALNRWFLSPLFVA